MRLHGVVIGGTQVSTAKERGSTGALMVDVKIREFRTCSNDARRIGLTDLCGVRGVTSY